MPTFASNGTNLRCCGTSQRAFGDARTPALVLSKHAAPNPPTSTSLKFTISSRELTRSDMKMLASPSGSGLGSRRGQCRCDSAWEAEHQPSLQRGGRESGGRRAGRTGAQHRRADGSIGGHDPGRTGPMARLSGPERWSPGISLPRRFHADGGRWWIVLRCRMDAVRVRLRRPFQWREFLEQWWFVARVSLAPTVLVAIPFTVLVSFTLNILLRELGAADSVRCGCGVRRGDPGRSAGDGVDRGGRGRHGDVCGSGFAHDPRGDRRHGSAGHQPGAAPGDPSDAGLGLGGATAQQPGGDHRDPGRLHRSRCSSRTSIRARSRRASPC